LATSLLCYVPIGHHYLDVFVDFFNTRHSDSFGYLEVSILNSFRWRTFITTEAKYSVSGIYSGCFFCCNCFFGVFWRLFSTYLWNLRKNNGSFRFVEFIWDDIKEKRKNYYLL